MRQPHARPRTHQNPPVPALLEAALRRGEGILTSAGALAVSTGKYTGRSPEDRYIVDDTEVHDAVDWGKDNLPIARDRYEGLRRRVEAALGRADETFVFQGFVGRDPAYRWPVRVVTDDAWRSLFARTLFIRGEEAEADDRAAAAAGFGAPPVRPTLTVLASSTTEAVPAEDGTRSEAFIILDLTARTVIIGGTRYAGEIKKSIFAFMNYVLPRLGVLSMHCGANVGPRGSDTALFFGLSGTGKTTLSADEERQLIGDDEHGWNDAGIFNLEGGCYAKCINLSREKEPQIWEALRFGAVLENVTVDPATRECDFSDDSVTENTRAAYPLSLIPGALPTGRSGHPQTLLFLSADAFGVLPPIARLSRDQAMYYFLSGYTSKLAGTERGITDPQETFSAGFGSPFLPLRAEVYAQLLGERLGRHEAEVYLVNTGWSGGPYGVGRRMDLPLTRTLVRAVIEDRLAGVSFRPDPVFGVMVPEACPGVPRDILTPRNTWADKAGYDRVAKMLAARFRANFARFGAATAAVREAGPRG
jgi:phosphoenolpyruvate carboxykinase (ATP)